MAWRGVLLLLIVTAKTSADPNADARAAAAADHLRTGELRDLLTKAGVKHTDCKEKEDLVQRVLESEARELLPEMELDELLIVDEEEEDPAAVVTAEPQTEAAPSAEASPDTSATPDAEEPEAADGDDAPGSAAAEPEAAEQEAAEPGAAEPAAAAASKLGESKLAQSKVPGEADAAAAAPAAAVAEYTGAQLSEDLELVRMTAAMGMASQMMEVLARIGFGLADTDRDGKISRTEATGFATSHLRDGQPLAKTLGLSGGAALPLDDATAVAKGVDAAFGACDANSDGLVDKAEARATPCRQHFYDLLVAPPPQPAASSAAGAASGAAAGAASAGARPAGGAKPAGGGTDWAELLKGMGGQAGGAPQKPHPIFGPLQQRLRRAQAMVLRNLRQPNFNTFLAGLGVVSFLLQQALTFDVLDARHQLRGLVGGNLPDFTNRLQNVAIGLFCVAAIARFD